MTPLRDTYFAPLARRGAHRVRAGLVVAHIAIAVALVIMVGGMAQGLSSTMHSGIDSFVGSLMVAPKQPSAQGSNAPRALRNSDVEALEQNVDRTLVKQIVPVVNGRAVIRSGEQDYGSIGVVGSNSGYLQLKLMSLAAGRMFTDQEYDNKARVTLIGPKLVSRFFGGDPRAAIGSELRVGLQRFEVIGVTSGDGVDDDTVLMPLTSSRSYLYGGLNNVVAIGALATNLDALRPATTNLQTILDQERFVKEPDKRDYAITSYTYLVPFMKSFLSVPRWFAVGATIALLFVGIFGLSNLMLITVAERRTRIRYRRATGVSAGRIIGEVLVGSMVIAGVGAVIGIALGVLAIVASWQVLPSFSALYALGLPPISLEAIGLTFGACLLVGLVSGAYPAIRAARIPVGGSAGDADPATDEDDPVRSPRRPSEAESAAPAGRAG